ncbi:hypothetical protein JTE90_004267, partial [Oedothorax gibbosus]
PGLWKSVESEDIYRVRKLVNLWCRTDLHKNGVALRDVALGTGNEEIISLILGIFDSMKLVYHIYAKDIRAISNLLEINRPRLRLDLRKMSDRGAPILYYLITSEYIAAIELFIKHGCQLYSIMQDDLGYDMPVLFSALNAEVSAAVVEALLPPGKHQQEELLYKILYRGHSVLEVALANNVNLDVFKVLIDRGGPLLLCDRNQANQTVRDLALLSKKSSYVNVIDQVLCDWIKNPNAHPGRREKLALYGWDFEVIKEDLKGNLYTDEFFTHFQNLQCQMQEICQSIESGDLNTFLELKADFENEDENFLWHGRMGDGMPLLHKAVIYNRLSMVEIILDHKPPTESIDNLFDQNRRTALHYASASASFKDIKKLLMSYGCSEHVLDKVNREPLDFRDKQDTADMMQLLDRLKTKDFKEAEVDPWSDDKVVQIHTHSSPSTCCHSSNTICEGTTSEPSDCESFSEASEEESTRVKSCVIF